MEKPLFLVIQRESKSEDYILATNHFFLKKERALDFRDTLEMIHEPQIVRIDGAVAATLHVLFEVVKRQLTRRHDGKTPKKEDEKEERTQPESGEEQGQEKGAE